MLTDFFVIGEKPVELVRAALKSGEIKPGENIVVYDPAHVDDVRAMVQAEFPAFANAVRSMSDWVMEAPHEEIASAAKPFANHPFGTPQAAEWLDEERDRLIRQVDMWLDEANPQKAVAAMYMLAQLQKEIPAMATSLIVVKRWHGRYQPLDDSEAFPEPFKRRALINTIFRDLTNASQDIA